MPSPKPGVPHKKPGTVKGRSTKETRMHEKRGTSYPKIADDFQHCKDLRLPRPEPRRARPERPMPAMDERFFLQRSNGEFLHMSAQGWTSNYKFAFWGTGEQIKNLTKKDRSLAELKRIPYRTVLGIGLANGESPR
jgi:hypothetical protein